MTPPLVKEHCRLDAAGQSLLKAAVARLGFSARSFDRVLKVSRTLADLSGSASIRPNDIAEALAYRSLDRALV
jgi:magnesium chelatase family protein